MVHSKNRNDLNSSLLMMVVIIMVILTIPKKKELDIEDKKD